MNNDITQWEYTTLSSYESRDFNKEMNELGKEGWEAAGTISSSSGYGRVIFKRPKQAQPDYNYSR